MPRPKGSKNRSVKDKIDDLIEDVKELGLDAKETAEAIDEIEDLLEVKTEVIVTEEVVAQVQPVKEKKMVGYHPITGKEVWI